MNRIERHCGHCYCSDSKQSWAELRLARRVWLTATGSFAATIANDDDVAARVSLHGPWDDGDVTTVNVPTATNGVGLVIEPNCHGCGSVDFQSRQWRSCQSQVERRANEALASVIKDENRVRKTQDGNGHAKTKNWARNGTRKRKIEVTDWTREEKAGCKCPSLNCQTTK